MSEQHILRRFDEELDKLRTRLIKMGSLVQEQIELATQAMIENNHEIAKVIIERDDKIDKLDLKIDKQCLRIFALHQPVATDLRLVMSAVSINDNMELIGDSVGNIGKCIVAMDGNPVNIEKTKFADMAKVVEVMIVKVMDAFIYSDVELAKQALELRSEVSKYRRENFEILVELIKENVQYAEYYSYYHDINRNLQFISELALNIAEEMVFLIDAKIVKHQFSGDKEDDID